MALSAACHGPERPKLLGTPGRTGTAAITGMVKRTKPLPPLQSISHGAFAECPPAPPRAEPVSNGRVAEAYVHVADGLPPGDYPLPKEPAVLDQRGCEFEPRVFGLRAGQDLLLRNDDKALHNVHSLGPGGNAFNLSMPQGRPPVSVFLPDAKSPSVLTCDVHPWMKAYAGVSTHPFFAVTGSDGAFALRGLPAGSYTLEAWSERAGRATAHVDLKEGETKSVEISLDGDAAGR